MNRRCRICRAVGEWKKGLCTGCQRAEWTRIDANAQRKARKLAKYDHRHRVTRQAWEHVIATTGSAPCARCDEPIWPDDEWHLDHLDDGTSAPSHAFCNTSEGGRSGSRTMVIVYGGGDE